MFFGKGEMELKRIYKTEIRPRRANSFFFFFFQFKATFLLERDWHSRSADALEGWIDPKWPTL